MDKDKDKNKVKNKRALIHKYHLKMGLILLTVVMLTVNVVLGLLLMSQSQEAMQTQIRERMLDVSNSAAALLDGDVLEKLTAEDEDTKEYQDSLDVLRAFQENVDLEYIYGIRDMGDGTFTFTIDPAEEDPGEFGSPVKYTEALYQASQGTAAVDENPYEDEWGRFYSSYSPVLNSQGKVVGIVAADFAAGWYDEQVNRHMYTVIISCVLSLVFGGVIVFLITGRMRRGFVKLNKEMKDLTVDMAELAGELRIASGLSTGHTDHVNNIPSFDENSYSTIGSISELVHDVRKEMHEYIAEAHALAYTDAMTGVMNRTAYIERVERLNGRIHDGTASFAIVIFDVNGLKEVNDKRGHECGDMIIIDTARALREVFRTKNVYRVGGDEFIAVLDDATDLEETLDNLMHMFDRNLIKMNRRKQENDVKLAVSKGAAIYNKDEDTDFNVIFRRADEAMYKDKAEYYKVHGDRRKR